MVKSLFSNGSNFVFVTGKLLNWIVLHKSTRQGCHLARYLHIIAAKPLGFLLDATKAQDRVHSILIPGSTEVINSHF